VLLSALLLASCGSDPYRPTAKVENRDVLKSPTYENNEIDVDSQDLDNPALEAEDLNVSRGEYYERQSQTAQDSNKRVNAALNAAEYYIQGQDFDGAERAVANLYREDLNQTQSITLTLILTISLFLPLKLTLTNV